MPGTGTTERGGWLERFAVIVAALVLVLLCLIPPDGLLTDNEEDYFQLAARSVAAAPASPLSAVFDSSHHRAVFDHLLGWLIALAGFGGAQVLTSMLAALAYGLALAAVFRRLGLDALDAVLVVIIFALLGQAMFGREWLFEGRRGEGGRLCLRACRPRCGDGRRAPRRGGAALRRRHLFPFPRRPLLVLRRDGAAAPRRTAATFVR